MGYRSINSVTLVGRLGKDPEIRNTQAGKAIANLTLATSEKWRDRDGDQKEATEWHRVVCFNEKLAEIIEKYAHKGDLVAVQGKLVTRKWEKDGIERYATEIVIDAFNGSFTILAQPDGNKDSGGRRDDDRRDDRRDSRRDPPRRDDRRDDRGGRDAPRGGGGWDNGGTQAAGRRSTADLDDDIPF